MCDKFWVNSISLDVGPTRPLGYFDTCCFCVISEQSWYKTEIQTSHMRILRNLYHYADDTQFYTGVNQNQQILFMKLVMIFKNLTEKCFFLALSR